MANIREKLDNCFCGLTSLTVFRNILKDDVISALSDLLELQADGKSFDVNIYSEFVSRLYRHTTNLSEYIFRTVCEDVNFYISGKSEGKCFDELIEQTVTNELELLRDISQLTPEELQYGYYRIFPLAQWKTSDIDFAAGYSERIRMIGKYGYGMYARNKVFIMRDKSMIPVKHPDSQRLCDLYGYERERQSVISNTLALIDGKPAQNTLLYGDAGTGKSSTVKAIVNEYADRGLRLVEITKEQLRDIPDIIDELSRNPLKFILFIDDLSFSSGDDCFGALKATLEGSVSSKADNIVIYATSNRRHLVKESFSDRDGDDVHCNDTMQELLSLSARFGLRVNFSKPDKKSYISIASALAKQNGIEMSEDELSLKAESFALQGNGRSPRTAKQFVNQLINEK